MQALHGLAVTGHLLRARQRAVLSGNRLADALAKHDWIGRIVITAGGPTDLPSQGSFFSHDSVPSPSGPALQMPSPAIMGSGTAFMSLHAAPTIFPSHGAPDEGVAMVAGVASDAGEAGAGDEVVGADDAEVGGDTVVAVVQPRVLPQP